MEGAMHAPDEWLRLRVVNHQFYINMINQIICCSLPSIIPSIAAPPASDTVVKATRLQRIRSRNDNNV
jgi:hypothetical protein